MLGESLRERFGERPEVAIKHDALKLLASDTRLSILKLLDQRRMTVSELARALSLNKSTVHEHLGKLVEGGLIRRDESEEREWVYYDLTKTARYVLQPASARFVLLMGAAVASGLVLVAFLHVMLTAGQGLAIALDEAVVPAGEANLWSVDVSRPGLLGFREPVGEARLFLLTAEEAAEYQLTKQVPPTAKALDQRAGLVQSGAGRYAFRAALDPGVHYLLAMGGRGLPDALHPVRAEPVQVLPHTASLLLGVDPPQVEVAVRFRDRPVAAGLVQAVDEEGRELGQVPVLNGRALVSLSGPADEVHFRFQPAAPGSTFAEAKGALATVEPHVAFAPAQVPLLVPTQVRVVVDDPGLGPREGAPVTLVRAEDGRPVAAATTDAAGAAPLEVRLTEPGEFILKAGDREVGRIAAKPGIRLWVEPGPHWEGERFRVRALHLGQEPNAVAGAAVLLDGREVGVTDEQGWLTLQFGLGGRYALESRRAGFVPGETAVDVLPRTGFVVASMQARAGFAGARADATAPVPQLEPRVTVAPGEVPLGEPVRVRALLRNPDSLPRVVPATLTDDGRFVERRAVEVPANGTGWVEFDFEPAAPGQHQLRVNDLPPVGLVVHGADAEGSRAVPAGPGWAPLAALGAAAGLAVALRRRR